MSTTSLTKYVIGVMSGTSLDGIDLAYIKFTKNTEWDFKVLKTKTKDYSDVWQVRLREAINLRPNDIEKLDAIYTKYVAETINTFIDEHDIEQVDLIASHGHTVFHQPEAGLTLQIGNQPELAYFTKKKVVCDFRVQDVELGGQGAPLVPLGDRMLFNNYDYCLNIGGFANVSFSENNKRLAFDICPANIVLNHYAGQLNMLYDIDGKIADNNKVDKKLLEKLNSIHYYKKDYPKSMGFEEVRELYFPIIDNAGLSSERVLATYTEHVAMQIGKVLKNSPKGNLSKTVFVTGGGALNKHLISRIKEHTSVKVVLPPKEIIEYKEALIFALIGLLRDLDEVNILKSVTGAKEDHSSGKVYLP